MATEPRFLYADSSALTKLIVEEPESDALRCFLAEARSELFSSRIAAVEVTRAAKTAAGPASAARLDDLLAQVVLVDVSDDLIDRARQIASVRLRTLDAIHLASALEVDPDVVVAYDRRLLDGARALGLAVASPS